MMAQTVALTSQRAIDGINQVVSYFRLALLSSDEAILSIPTAFT